MSTSRTRLYFLRDTFQSRFIIVSLLHYLVISLTFAGTLFIPIMIRFDDMSLSMLEKGRLANEFISLHDRVWVPLLVILVLLVIHSVLFSHRIAGPLYRFRNIFKAVGEGNLSLSANIRKYDYLTKEAECLDEMITSLRSRIQDIETQCHEISGTLTDLNGVVERGSMSEVDQTKKRLVEQQEQLRASMNRFKTSA